MAQQSMPDTLSIPPQQSGKRIDVALASLFDHLSRRDAQKLCGDGRVLVNGRRVNKSTVVHTDDRLSIDFGPTRVATPVVAELNIRLVTAHWVIVAKPPLVPTAPRNSEEQHTLANALLHAFPEMAQVGYRPLEPGLLHRLDNGTSGLLVCARTREAFERARRALKASEWHKSYLAIVCSGHLPESGTLTGELSSVAAQPQRVLAKSSVELRGGRVHPDRRTRLGTFQTSFETLIESGGLSLLRVYVGPAFRHQIRAHFAEAGCPLLNDEVYGAPRDLRLAAGRHALHAARVAWGGEPPLEGFDVNEPLAPDLAALFEPPSLVGL